MRNLALPFMLVAALLAPLAATADERSGDTPGVVIRSIEMADAHSLQVDLATWGLDSQGAEPPTVTLSVWLDGVPAQATLPLIHMPPRFAMVFDLPAGVVKVGGVAVGTFHPVPPFTENMRFPVEVTIRHGSRVATARGEATILLPTVIVPGYLGELAGPDREVLAAFARRGYTDTGPSPTLFWFRYPSRQVALEEGAQSLAAYVRRVVLPATYAARINVVGYSVGGLMARWNVQFNTDGWSRLINRLVLIGVPNEGAVMAYVGEHAPPFLPFAGWGKSQLVRDMTPTFPFWRDSPAHAWSIPPDGDNSALTRLNARPIPAGIRVYLFYGSHDPRNAAGPQTTSGIIGFLPGAALSYGSGDGIVLAASAQGLPIHGGQGVAGLADRAVLRVDLGSVYHGSLLTAGADRITAALLDRFLSRVDEDSAEP